MRETTRVGLVFRRLKAGKPRVIQGYVDTDYARDLDQRRSTIGYVFIVAGYIINWKAELQDTFILSMIEAEYMTAVELSNEAL